MRDFIIYMWNCPAPAFVGVVFVLLLGLGIVYEWFFKPDKK